MLTKFEKDNLEIFVLATLSKEPSYGYKIIEDLENVIKISESTLYPILKRLENKNDVTTYKVEINGRTRKYFRITEQGFSKVDNFVDEINKLSNIFSYILRK